MKRSFFAAAWLMILLLILSAAAGAAEDKRGEQALYYGTLGKKMNVHRFGDADSMRDIIKQIELVLLDC